MWEVDTAPTGAYGTPHTTNGAKGRKEQGTMEAMTLNGEIPAERQDALTEAVAKLNKRATKLEMPEVVLTFGERFWKSIPNETAIPRRELYVPVTIIGQAIHFDGWQVVAAIDIADKLVIVRSHREERPEWRQGAGKCDHCGVSRRRAKTVVVENANGDQKLVGVDCLKDFVPSHSRDLEAILRMHEMLLGLLDSSEEESMGGSTRQSFLDPTDFLPFVAELVLNHGGYVSAATAERLCVMSTADAAVLHCYGRNVPDRIKPSDMSIEYAKAALAWAAALNPASTYEQNICAIAKAGFCGHRHLGFLASIIPAYKRTMEKARERQVSQATSKHVGVVGERLACKVSLVKVIEIQSLYGTSHLHIFVDDAGNRLKWFCSGMRPDFPTDGAFVAITGMVKNHGVRDSVQETCLSRVTLGKPKATKARKAKVAA